MAEQPKGNILAVWLTVLCAANDSPQRGVLLVGPTLPVMVDEIADIVGYDTADVEAILNAFEILEMIECVDGIYRVLHWGDRQFASDNSTERVRKFRTGAKGAEPSSSPPGGEPSSPVLETVQKRDNVVTVTEVKRFSNAPETETETESSLSQNARVSCETKPELTITDTQEETVRQIILDLHGLYDLSSKEVGSLGNEILESVVAGYSHQMISQAYQVAFARAEGPVGPYARAILVNWAETGPPQKGVYSDKNGPKGFGKGQRSSNGYTGQGAPGQGAISSLSGRSVDDPIKEIWNPKTGEEYYIDVRTGERVTESGEALVIQ